MLLFFCLNLILFVIPKLEPNFKKSFSLFFMPWYYLFCSPNANDSSFQFPVSSWIRKQYSYEIFIVCILLSLLLIYLRRLFIYRCRILKIAMELQGYFCTYFCFISFLYLVYLRSLATIIWWFFIVRLTNNTRINTTVTFQRTKKGQKINIKTRERNIISIKLRTNVQTSHMRDKKIYNKNKSKPEFPRKNLT